MKGLEKIWIFSDDFGFNSFEKYYNMQPSENQYMSQHFEVHGFLNIRKPSIDQNTVSRFRNMMVGAVADKIHLPKRIVIVPDYNIICYFKYKDTGVSEGYGCLLNWIMTQHDHILETHKENLPVKAKLPEDSTIIWIEPPTHRMFRDSHNELR